MYREGQRINTEFNREKLHDTKLTGAYMEAYKENITMKCTTCGEETEWHPILIVINRITFAYKCDTCGKIVPEESLNMYLRTGNVIVTRRNKR